MSVKFRKFLSYLLSVAIVVPILFLQTGAAIAEVPPDNISVLGSPTGNGGTFKINDTIRVNVDTVTVSGVTVDFSQFGGPSAAPTKDVGGDLHHIYQAEYLIHQGSEDNLAARVGATVDGVLKIDDQSYPVDNQAPGKTGQGVLTIEKKNNGDVNVVGIGDQVRFALGTLDGSGATTWTVNFNNLTGETNLSAGSLSSPVPENNLTGEYSFDVTGTDDAGNISRLEGGTNTIKVDTKRPKLISAKTENLNTISAQFDEKITASSVGAADFALSDPLSVVALAVTKGPDTVKITVTPSFTNASTPTLTVKDDGSDSIYDIAGNEIVLGSNVVAADGIAPSAPTITDPQLPSITNSDAITILGTADAGSKITVYSDPNNDGDKSDGQLLTWATATTTGTFSISVGLTQNSDNHFLVTSSDAAGNESDVAAVPTITEDSTGPIPPAQFGVARNGDYIDLSWSSSEGVQSYEIWRSSSPYILLAQVPSTTLTYTDKTVQKGVKYYYKVIAVDVYGNRSETAELSTMIPLDQTDSDVSSSSSSSSFIPIVTASFEQTVESVEVPQGEEPAPISPQVVRVTPTPEPSVTPEVLGAQSEPVTGESWWPLIIPVALVLVIGAALPLTAATAIAVPLIGAILALILASYTTGDIKSAYMYLMLGGETVILLLINYGLLATSPAEEAEEEVTEEKPKQKNKKNKKRK